MTFAQHLDAHLATPAHPQPTVLPDDAHHAWFVDVHAVEPEGRVTRRTAPRCDDPPTPQTTENQPPIRRWSGRQCRALDTLRILGADLCDEPVFSDVRAAWRRLAFTLHPDTGGDTADRHAFTTAAAAWEPLRTGPETVQHRTQDMWVGLR